MKHQKPYSTYPLDKILLFAKKLRRTQTSSEKFLWHILRDRKICGKKFRRQHPLGKFIVDFYCHEAKLVIELDGNIHEIPRLKANDKERQETIEQLELTVLRFTNDEIFDDLDKVLQKIINHANSRSE